MARYENPIEHTCDVSVGQQWISTDGGVSRGYVSLSMVIHA